ncbi:unnamed protein product [Heterobilharzia americana]|nr:unnamed protein product [Heterobilharzia americana]
MWCKPCRRKKKCIRFISEMESEDISIGGTQQTGNHSSSTTNQITHFTRHGLANFIDPFIHPIHTPHSLNLSSQSSKFHSFPSSGFLYPSLNLNTTEINKSTSLSSFNSRLKSHVISDGYTGKSSAFIKPLYSSYSNRVLDGLPPPLPPPPPPQPSLSVTDSYHPHNSTFEQLNFKLTPSSSSSSSSSSFSLPTRSSSLTSTNHTSQCLSDRYNKLDSFDTWNTDHMNSVNNFYPNWSEYSSAFKLSSSSSSIVTRSIPSITSISNIYHSNDPIRKLNQNQLYENNLSDDNIKFNVEKYKLSSSSILNQNTLIDPYCLSLNKSSSMIEKMNCTNDTIWKSPTSLSSITESINMKSIIDYQCIELETTSSPPLPPPPPLTLVEVNSTEPPSKRVCNSPLHTFNTSSIDIIVSTDNSVHNNNNENSALYSHSTSTTSPISTSTSTTIVSSMITTHRKYGESVRFGVADFMGINDEIVASVIDNSIDDNNNTTTITITTATTDNNATTTTTIT